MAERTLDDLKLLRRLVRRDDVLGRRARLERVRGRHDVTLHAQRLEIAPDVRAHLVGRAKQQQALYVKPAVEDEVITEASLHAC